MKRKFVITGPESTGKSTLTKMLAEEYNVTWVKEYAREYLNNLTHPYTFENVIEMAKIQLQKEQEAIIQNDLVFLDTDLTVFHVWIKEKYNKEIDWINEHLAQAQNKIYFLCDIDIPWEEDVLREHPKLVDRERLFNEYQKLFELFNLTYYVISGDKIAREKKAKEIINKLI
jgi:nicotinamide riboside kinase